MTATTRKGSFYRKNRRGAVSAYEQNTAKINNYILPAIGDVKLEDVYTVDQYVSKDRRSFLDGQIRKSQKKTRMKPSENHRMITLSTCTSRTEEGRFVVQAAIVPQDQ